MAPLKVRIRTRKTVAGQMLNKDAAGKSQVILDFASAALRAGDRLKAEMLLRDRLVEDPSDANALAKLAEIAIQSRRIEEATVHLRKALAAEPTPRRRLNLIVHLKKHVGAAAALQEIETLPAAVRETSEAMAIEAAVLGTLGRHAEQIGIYDRMVRRGSSNAGLWMSLGNALKTVGRTDEAVKALKKAIKLQDTLGEAYWTLANFKSVRFAPREINQMRSVLRKDLSPEDALHIQFALGKALEDEGQYESSFRHYSAGNALRARTFSSDQMSVTKNIDDAIEQLTPELFQRFKGAGCTAPDPIFVFGLHRSGSTLVEQILASHLQVEGTTELPAMNTIAARLRRLSGLNVAEAIVSLDPAELTAIGEEYMERTRPFRHTDRPFFVDKMPSNWVNLLLIRLALPNAKLVDARRHPMACGFSNYKQNYAAGLAFSYDLKAIGQFYADYWRFMRHFDHIQPGAVHRVINERLIDDPEGEVRRLLDHLGLPFAASCLEFHKNTRAVRTPSAEQVRRPINSEGVDQWRNYEPWLGELKTALGTALEEWDR